MINRSDAKFLSEVKLCEIADVKRPRRQQWANRDLLRRGGADGYGELDAVELVVLRLLVSILDYEDAVVAWRQVREAVASALLRAGNLDLVFDVQTKVAAVATNAEELATHVRHGRLMRVLPLAPEIALVRDAARRLRDEQSRRTENAPNAAPRKRGSGRARP